MRAALLDAPVATLRVGDLPDSQPGPGQVLLRVRACGVCSTDLQWSTASCRRGTCRFCSATGSSASASIPASASASRGLAGPTARVRTHVTTYALEQTPDALDDLRAGRRTGAAVVVPTAPSC